MPGCDACNKVFRMKGRTLKQEIAGIAARSPYSERRVRQWRVAGRATLLLLLTFSGLQYYFFDVFLTIMALPSVTLVAALP